MSKEAFDNLEKDLVQLIADITGRDPAELKPEVNFWKDLGIDSIKAIEITVAIERKYKISIRDEQIPKITTIGEAVKVVKQSLEKKDKS
ncbi:MAG: acyl carrier protein [Candidatus Omnitrophota bacterium]